MRTHIRGMICGVQLADGRRKPTAPLFFRTVNSVAVYYPIFPQNGSGIGISPSPQMHSTLFRDSKQWLKLFFPLGFEQKCRVKFALHGINLKLMVSEKRDVLMSFASVDIGN